MLPSAVVAQRDGIEALVPGVLAAAGRLVHEPRRGRAPFERHRQRLLPHGRLQMRAHRSAHHGAPRHVHQPRPRPPARSRPSRGDLAGPHVLGRRPVPLTRQPMRRDLIAGSAVRGHGTPSSGTGHAHTRLAHHPPRLRAAPVTPGLLTVCGPAPTTITVTRRRGHRVDPGPEGTASASTAAVAWRGRSASHPWRLTSRTSPQSDPGQMSCDARPYRHPAMRPAGTVAQGLWAPGTCHPKPLLVRASPRSCVVSERPAPVTGQGGAWWRFTRTCPATPPLGLEPQLAGRVGHTVALRGHQPDRFARACIAIVASFLCPRGTPPFSLVAPVSQVSVFIKPQHSIKTLRYDVVQANLKIWTEFLIQQAGRNFLCKAGEDLGCLPPSMRWSSTMRSN